MLTEAELREIERDARTVAVYDADEPRGDVTTPEADVLRLLAALREVTAQRDEAVNALQQSAKEMLEFSSTDGSLRASMDHSPSCAEAIRILANHHRCEIVSDDGRRVVAKWKEKE